MQRLSPPLAAASGDYDELTECLACWRREEGACLPCCQRKICVDCLPKVVKKPKCPYHCKGVLDTAKLFADAGIPPPRREREWLGREYFEGDHDIDDARNKTEEAARSERSGVWTHHRCRHCNADHGLMHWGLGSHDIHATSRTRCRDCQNEKELVAVCLNNCVAVVSLVEVFSNARKKKFDGEVDALGKFITMQTPGALRRCVIEARSTTTSTGITPEMLGPFQPSQIAGAQQSRSLILSGYLTLRSPSAWGHS